MINLEKIKSEKCQPLLPPRFKKTCPCTILPPPFLIFHISLSGGGNQKKAGAGVQTMHLNNFTRYISTYYQAQNQKKGRKHINYENIPNA